MAKPHVLYLEPFHGGSHARFGETLIEGLPGFRWQVHTLPARHWKWRMRGSAVAFARRIGHEPVDLIVASSYLPLAELLGLRPDLGGVPSVLHFHENQLAFPARPGERHPERDHHFGFTQIVSALAATRCVFNSRYNMRSFIGGARDLLGRMPDLAPASWADEIETCSEVLGVPLPLPELPEALYRPPSVDPRGPLLLWNHRWEHDKGPEVLFEALARVDAPFRLAVCGQRFGRVPGAFEAGRIALGERVVHWGGEDDRETYESWLKRADVVVSTARHEFFGIALLEATHYGAQPLAPDDLAYCETVPADNRYPRGELATRLEALCHAYLAGQPLRADRRAHTRVFSAAVMLPRYEALLRSLLH